VAGIVEHPENEHNSVNQVQLRTCDARLVVTADHMVMVPRGDTHQQQAVPAPSLRPGHPVYINPCEGQALIDVEHFSRPARVYQIVFDPDVPVESFNDLVQSDDILINSIGVAFTTCLSIQHAILTKGHKSPKPCRFLTNRRSELWR
jgi:hypothetical protein